MTAPSNLGHEPVLVSEIMEHFGDLTGKVVLDATFGLGGHTRVFAKSVGVNGRVIALEADPESIAHAKAQHEFPENVMILNGNFQDLSQILSSHGIKSVDRILMDLGISSWQLEHSGRGFSFNDPEVLDMRVDPNLPHPAWWYAKTLGEKNLRRALERVGERYAPRISSAVSGFVRGPVSAQALAGEVGRVAPQRGKLHPATKLFLALRLLTNNEEPNLETALEGAHKVLACNGIVAVVSFHSLEDRIVKLASRTSGWKALTKKPIVPPDAEITRNPRARSARLRVIQKECIS
jgi:16S rRNA (cytosine1402-N4)-methyltransferase